MTHRLTVWDNNNNIPALSLATETTSYGDAGLKLASSDFNQCVVGAGRMEILYIDNPNRDAAGAVALFPALKNHRQEEKFLHSRYTLVRTPAVCAEAVDVLKMSPDGIIGFDIEYNPAPPGAAVGWTQEQTKKLQQILRSPPYRGDGGLLLRGDLAREIDWQKVAAAVSLVPGGEKKQWFECQARWIVDPRLLQLSTGDKTYVFDLHALAGPKGGFMREFPSPLTTLFANASLRFCGVGIRGDLTHLRSRFPSLQDPVHVLELRTVDIHGKKGGSLASILARCGDDRLDKNLGGGGYIMWDGVLSTDNLEYAANDACASALIGRRAVVSHSGGSSSSRRR